MSDNEEDAGNVGGIMSAIDSEQLIKEVEKRPALYNIQLKEYSDRNIREKMWGEVCSLVVPNWTELSTKDKKINDELKLTYLLLYFYACNFLLSVVFLA